MKQINEMILEFMRERQLDVDSLRDRLEEGGHSYSRDHLRRVVFGRRLMTQRVFRAIVLDALEVDREDRRELVRVYVYNYAGVELP